MDVNQNYWVGFWKQNELHGYGCRILDNDDYNHEEGYWQKANIFRGSLKRKEEITDYDPD